MGRTDRETYYLSRRVQKELIRRGLKMQQIVHVATEAADEQSEIFQYAAVMAAETLQEAWRYKQKFEGSELQEAYEALWYALTDKYRERMLQVSHEAALEILDVLAEMSPELDEGLLLEQMHLLLDSSRRGQARK